jgi:ribosomal protein S18 acetylase RimI-like enzyme
MEIIKSLSDLNEQEIYKAFADAFADYELQLNKEQLLVMLYRRGWVPELSFGAFFEGRLVSFTLNGIGMFNGSKTAYDTGTGTIKSFRGKGLASAIFKHSIPFLKGAGVKQYLLEVLQHNTAAVSLYKKLGFEISREFNYFSEEAGKISPPEKPLLYSLQIKAVTLSQIESLTNFQDFPPSWQNSFEAIGRNPEDFKIFGACQEQELVGYCVFEPVSGDITQLAVFRNHRRKGIASGLLANALKSNQNDAVKCINTEISCTSINSFLQSNGITLKGKQFEMIKQL